jgi:hypothetical protein
MLSLPKASTSGLPALRSPQELPDMTTAPNGELRRQDLHLQVQQLVSLRSLPWVLWASVPHLPRYYAPRRLPPCPSQVASLVARFPIPCPPCAFVVSLTGSWPGRGPQTTPGLLVTRSPMPGMCQGARGLSQVPALPLWMPAPLSDPGGVLRTRLRAPRTVACRPLEAVGFPFGTAEGYPRVHDATHCGAQSRGLHLRSIPLRTPITGCARGCHYRSAG